MAVSGARRSWAMVSIMFFLDCSSSLFFRSEDSSSLRYRRHLFTSRCSRVYSTMASRNTKRASVAAVLYDFSRSAAMALYLVSNRSPATLSKSPTSPFSLLFSARLLKCRLSIWADSFSRCSFCFSVTSRLNAWRRWTAALFPLFRVVDDGTFSDAARCCSRCCR